jgi:hypothetical protein
VTKVRANTVIPLELLNIPHLMTLYPQQDEMSPDGREPFSDVDEVQRTIEEFRKKFDP